MKTIQYQKYEEATPLRIAAEPEVLYVARKAVDLFPIDHFQELSTKLLFTQQEWADILHISDRTLQRYIKEGKPFEGLYAEHLYQLENMAELGLEVFRNARAFDEWLRLPREVLGERQDFYDFTLILGCEADLQRIGAHGTWCVYMIAYRLAAKAYAGDFSGTGAKLFGGRWNPVGYPCIYASLNLSLALLEKYVHAEFRENMERLVVLRLNIPDDEDLVFHIDDQLMKKQWAADISYSQWIGEQILCDPEIIAFTAPSAIVPLERNVVLNPLAKQFKLIEFLPPIDFPTDLRLLAKLLS